MDVKNVIVLGLGSALLFGCSTAPAYRVEDRRIILESPFALQIGSTEYAKSFGDLLHTSSYANYDPLTKTTTTNLHHSVEAWLATPYFGCERGRLIFEGEEKALKSCDFNLGEGRPFGKGTMTYADCAETVRKIAADIEKRIGIKMPCRNEKGEESLKARVAEKKKRPKQSEKHSSFALGFNFHGGHKIVNGVSVDYDVSGLYGSEGGCYVRFGYSKSWSQKKSSAGNGGKIPVYTNKLMSAVAHMPTEEQKRAHEEAKKLRETIRRLFGIDLDKPDETFDLSSAASLTNAEKYVRREWTAIEKPFEGLTERKLNQSVQILAIPFGVCALRRPYAGDVSAAELEAQAKRVLAGLEREYGEKIPKADTKEGAETLAIRFGEGVPTFGDTKVPLRLDKKTYFIGNVGDLVVEIAYAEPRYVKKSDKYEIVCKGAVVLSVIQSPILTRDNP